jgi:hypothetical protein
MEDHDPPTAVNDPPVFALQRPSGLDRPGTFATSGKRAPTVREHAKDDGSDRNR